MNKNPTKAAVELYEILLDAIESGAKGDYALCTAIVDAFRETKGEDAAKKCRRVLWEMIQEEKERTK